MTFALLLLLAALPDRTPLADEWGYRPVDGSTVPLDPPSLTWTHEPDAASYTVQWARDPDFRAPAAASHLPWPAYTHRAALGTGRWFWRYRIHRAGADPSPWSRTRSFIVPPGATVFPQPTIEELRARIGAGHPRLFFRRQDLPRLRAYAAGAGSQEWQKLRQRADELLAAAPTPEPAVKASPYDPATNQYWWSNRLQTIRAANEVEILAFVFLMTEESKYGQGAARNLLRLAAWDPGGATGFELNCEAAKPLLHRLARGYDWAYAALLPAERETVRAVLLRRAWDAWVSREVREGAGHLNQPYSSHGNRTWHKLAENAVATLGETPEAERFLNYAVTKFFAAYPVWSDDDGGWHEGLAYFGGYMSKAAWWMDLAKNPLGIDPFRKPFFRHFGDYALYSAPPGSPDLGLGDLAFRPPSSGWSFLHFYARRMRSGRLAWWLDQWRIPQASEEPVLGFLWGADAPVSPQPPSELPPSKVFQGTGVAILNTTLLRSADNVQVRFKSSPMGRVSHGHEPHNSFTLNGYGVPLLVNNVYRDLYGTPFHKDWVWSTRAQNAVLVNGEGQKVRSADVGGRIVRWQFAPGFDYVEGDATPAYEGRLTRVLRHVLFVKPGLIVLVDELEAPAPATFQWMLHGQVEFSADQAAQRLVLQRPEAGVVVDYVAEQPLQFRQWTGYTPEPDHRYLKSINSPGIPPQWHVEAASRQPAARATTLTVLRPYRGGQAPAADLAVLREPGRLRISAGELSLLFPAAGRVFAEATAGKTTWVVPRR